MTPRGARERPLAANRLSLALGLALAWLALGGTTALAVPRPPRVPTIYHKSRSFRIPFNVDPADRARLKDVQLWVSKDLGYTWKLESRTNPDRPSFNFRASRDGEYWFAVRTLDSKGNLYPGEDEDVEPSMKVVVDSAPPSLVLEPEGRRGSLVAVRWEVRDEHLDLKSLVIEYQAEGARDWRAPEIRPALIGDVNWDAGTAAALKVRASVSDKAGNVTEVAITLSEGTPQNPGLASNDTDFGSPPPVSQISSGPTISPSDEPQNPRATPSNAPAVEQQAFPPPPQDRPTSPSAAGMPNGPEIPVFPGETEPFAGNNAGAPGATSNPPAPVDPGFGNPPSEPTASAGGTSTLLVAGPQFPLKYAVDDAGPAGPAKVELWVTQDGGRTWFQKGEDQDRVSPFPVDLGGEGTFGIRLVARSASGLGDQPPGPGDPPDMRVEVDSTPPTVQMLPPQVGTGPNMGKVAIRWRASDLHLGQKAVVISWRGDQPGGQWQLITPAPIANSGSYTWNVPENIPPRFHLRVDVVDTAGNRAWAETTEGAPVLVDRTRPKSRIIGLDPSARAGNGPGGRTIR